MISHEYGSLGFEIPVVHHTELLAELMDQRRLPVEVAVRDLSGVVYHEPCNLARAGLAAYSHTGLIALP